MAQAISRKTRRRETGYREIVTEMRRRITAGAWPPASRIPTKLGLCAEFGVSDATVQRALNVLGQEEFLRSRGCAGTWVTDSPPHLSHIGVVFPDAVSRSKFWQAIVGEARRLQEHGPLRFHVYERCCYPVGPDHARLHEDLRVRRLAGIFMLASADRLLDRRLAENCGVVRIGVSATDPFRGAHRIVLPPALSGVLDYLHAKGRRRLALITTFSQFGPDPGQSGDLVRQAATMGMEVPSRFIHPVSVPEHYTACHTLELMMSLPERHRPDAVYIMDDHLVEQATLGIRKARVTPGSDARLEVVAHANFPAPPATHVPVTFHGHDIRALVAAGAGIVSDVLAGRKAPKELCLPPVFASELPYGLA